METLQDWKLIVGIVATIAGGLWTVYVHFDRKRGAAGEAAEERAGPRATAAHRVEARSGIAAGRDVTAGRVTVNAFPPGAVLVTLAGLALVGWAMIAGTGGTQVDVRNECGAAAGGNIEGATITIENCEAGPAAD